MKTSVLFCLAFSWLGVSTAFAETPVPSPTPSPSPAPTTSSSSWFNPYGFVKAGYIFSTRAVDSTQAGYTNLSCPTTARPDLTANDSKFRGSFQVAQTRFGTWIQKGESSVKGQLEFDLLDFAVASPTVHSKPRLRIAKVAYTPSKENEFNFGQDWDPFSPFRPFSNGMMGILFQSGNVGFMRQQVKWQYKQESFSYALAAVFAGAPNNLSPDGNVELGTTPGLTQQITVNIDKSVKIGTSATASLPRVNDVSDSFFGFNLFTNLKWADFPEIRIMGYYGKDLGTAGYLGIGRGGNHEAGGYLAFGGNLGGPWVYSGGVGMAYVMESYGSVLPGGSLGANRLKDNTKVDLSLGYKLTESLKIYTEYVYMLSHYTNSAGADLAFIPAHILDTGVRFDF